VWFIRRFVRGSPLVEQGLRSGDVIERIGNSDVSGPRPRSRALAEAGAKETTSRSWQCLVRSANGRGPLRRRQPESGLTAQAAT